MKIKFLSMLFSLGLLTYSNISAATIGVSLGAGRGTQDTRVYRLNLQKTWDAECATVRKHRFTGYWEAAVTQLIAKRVFEYPTNKYDQVYTAAAVVRLIEKFRVPLFMDLGVGLAYSQKKAIGGRDLGASLLFEERLSLGVLLGKKQQVEIGYRFVHLSNAYLASVNQGINLHLLVVGYWFK